MSKTIPCRHEVMVSNEQGTASYRAFLDKWDCPHCLKKRIAELEGIIEAAKESKPVNALCPQCGRTDTATVRNGELYCVSCGCEWIAKAQAGKDER